MGKCHKNHQECALSQVGARPVMLQGHNIPKTNHLLVAALLEYIMHLIIPHPTLRTMSITVHYCQRQELEEVLFYTATVYDR